MWFMIFKVVVAASVISVSSWLAGKRPDLAGFLISLPLATMLALPFMYAEYNDPSQAAVFARNILIAVPLSLSFFIPFLFAERLMVFVSGPYKFWAVYAAGVCTLACAYFVYQWIVREFLS